MATGLRGVSEQVRRDRLSLGHPGCESPSRPPASSSSGKIRPHRRRVRRLTQPGATDIAAAWSSDGSEILFRRGPRGSAELLVLDADGSHVRISHDLFRGYEPSWR